ncbi:MAG: hypothetical protein IPK02_13020 [Candidatus Accumulibacter sp.]|uniref:Uncharacterized protein n=1 Tax=Candidatus Accumulibacter affinis TaxID=2954384 RepID=A0A935TAF3_9PROT|nr:hypothetical protein [Candidatus Accumulibacter affinis]
MSVTPWVEPENSARGGAANLKTSEILFGYRAVRRELFSLNLLSLTSGFAKVSGTIGHPTVSLDPGGLLIAVRLGPARDCRCWRETSGASSS